MKVNEFISAVKAGEYDDSLTQLYGIRRLDAQRNRYENAAAKFYASFGNKDIIVLSVPGRTELLGNHTDHNGGKVLASAIDVDLIGVASLDTNIHLRGSGDINIDINNLTPDEDGEGSVASLVRGVVDAYSRCGLNYGGFDLYTLSDIKSGIGVSSSASFAILIGFVLSKLYNGGSVSPLALAMFAKYAENVHFGKECGIMDQISCGYGGTVYMDLKREDYPVVKYVNVDFSKFSHRMYLIDTKSSHRTLSDYYSAVSEEMRAVARVFGKQRLCDVAEEDIFTDIKLVRKKCGDRPVLRAMHFFEENRRVEKQMENLEKGDFNGYLDLVRESGDSSFKLLQNIYAFPNEQQISLALALAERSGVVARVHGGGFGGTIQCYVSPDKEAGFLALMRRTFGENACLKVNIGRKGAVEIRKEGIV